MEFVKNNSSNQSIEVGDLIECSGEICIVVGIKTAYIKDNYDRVELEYPYHLVSLNTGKVLNAIRDMKYLNSRYNLVSKNKDVVITY